MIYFEDLDIYPTEDLAKIKKAYLNKAKIYHPDNQDTGSTEKFKQISHAYKMLTDPSYRDEDRKRNHGPMNLDATMQLVISFDQSFFGDMVLLTVNQVMIDNDFIPTDFQVELEQKVVPLSISAGTVSGTHAIIKGLGLKKGDRVGNLIVSYQVAAHPKYSLSGPDVLSTELIPLDILITGGEVDIPTMWGIHTLDINPATIPGQKYLIPKCGVSRIGNHVVTVMPLYPSEQELKTSNIWKKLNIKWQKR